MPTIMCEFHLRMRDGLSYLVCTPLLAFGVIVATSTRSQQEHAAREGAWQGESRADGRRRLERAFAPFLSAVGLAPRPLITLRQRHTNRCLIFDPSGGASWSESPPIGDAVATRSGEVVLGIQTADCAPIFIFDPRTRARAAIHAGWRGTLGRIVERALTAMVVHFGTRAEDCYAAIGPTIGPCCYEVGPDVLEPFRREFPYAEAMIVAPTASGRARLDLVEANIRQLLACGLSRARIFASGLCTACHPQLFFSYRRDAKTTDRAGRMLSVIGESSS
ncbi:Laccase domain protein YfiH [bacterium HR08]|nr:Laccase domain protein YfiH [bacterium HR08]